MRLALTPGTVVRLVDDEGPDATTGVVLRTFHVVNTGRPAAEVSWENGLISLHLTSSLAIVA